MSTEKMLRLMAHPFTVVSAMAGFVLATALTILR
jgi:hypothetical protein